MSAPFDALKGVPIQPSPYVKRDGAVVFDDFGSGGLGLFVHPHQFNVLMHGPLVALEANIEDLLGQKLRELDMMMADASTDLDNAQLGLVSELDEFGVCLCGRPTWRSLHFDLRTFA